MRANALSILMVLSAIQVGASHQLANPAQTGEIHQEVGIYAVLQGEAKEVPSETVEAHRGGMFGLNGESRLRAASCGSPHHKSSLLRLPKDFPIQNTACSNWTRRRTIVSSAL